MRAPFIIGATVAGIVGIVAYHPHSSTGVATFDAPGTHPVGGSSTNSGASTTAPSAAGSAPGSTTPTTSGSAASPATAPPTTSPATTAPRSQASGNASGNVTQYRFGVLQVTATVSGGRISDVRTQVQSTDPRSQEIDDTALPILRQQAISAQSANIQGVSGATYTSQAFATSLQSALSSLGFNG